MTPSNPFTGSRAKTSGSHLPGHGDPGRVATEVHPVRLRETPRTGEELNGREDAGVGALDGQDVHPASGPLAATELPKTGRASAGPGDPALPSARPDVVSDTGELLLLSRHRRERLEQVVEGDLRDGAVIELVTRDGRRQLNLLRGHHSDAHSSGGLAPSARSRSFTQGISVVSATASTGLAPSNPRFRSSSRSRSGRPCITISDPVSPTLPARQLEDDLRHRFHVARPRSALR